METTRRITEDKFIDLYIKNKHFKTLGQNALALLESLEREGYIKVERE